MKVNQQGVGRPRAINDESIEAEIVRLYNLGYGYREVRNILKRDKQVDISFMAVKRLLEKKGLIRD